MIKILIADDHIIIREGICFLLKNILPDVLIEQAPNGDVALSKIKMNVYDLIILDAHMPGGDSFGLIANILARQPDARILMYSMNAEEIYAKRYFKAGVKGYINKEADAAELKIAIHNVLNNKTYVSPELNVILLEEMLGNIKANPFNDLSAKEFEILQEMLEGRSVTEMSKIFNVHTSTIGTHKARILEKLDCKNIIQLSQLAKLHNVTYN